MPFTFTVFSYLFSASIAWFLGIRLYKNFKINYTVTKNSIFASSFIGAALIGLSLFIYGVSSFFAPLNLSILKIGYILGHTNFFIAFAVLINGTNHFFENNKLLKITPILILLANAVLTGINILYYPFVNPSIDKYNLIHWGQPFVPRIVFLALMLMAAGIISMVFFIKRPKDENLKLKSLSMSLAFMTAGLGGGLICFLDSSFGLFMSYLSLVVGFSLALIASFIEEKQGIKKEE
ncbi:hypothetical protein KKA72_00515 [Patescibacteria group bacterium]|nr:hypothetical protein [Patescibacteria group bacterium]MBU1876821.1 hypothetical protein [Patescibacteria group bacterium]